MANLKLVSIYIFSKKRTVPTYYFDVVLVTEVIVKLIGNLLVSCIWGFSAAVAERDLLTAFIVSGIFERI